MNEHEHEHDAVRDELFAHDLLPWLPDVARFAAALARNAADADDLVQETFLRAYRYWTTFVAGSDGRRWLFTICRNIFLRQRARERTVVSVGDDAELETMAAVMQHVEVRHTALNDLFTRVDIVDLAPAIVRALGTLPAAYRAVVQLVDIDGMSYEEAADALDVPIGTVRSRLFRGRRLLQRELIDYARDAGFAAASPPSPASRPGIAQGEGE